MSQREFWNWLVFSTIAIILIVFALFASQQIPEDPPTPPDWVMVAETDWCNVMQLDGLFYAVSKDNRSVEVLTDGEMMMIIGEKE